MDKNNFSPATKGVCILTSVHSPFDVRIYHRQAQTLARAGYQLVLVATETELRQTTQNISVIFIPKPRWRLARILNWVRFVKIGLAQQAHIYHFHDPDLLFAGLLLHLLTKKPVIYDRHENYHEDILDKEWIPKFLRQPVSFLFRHIEQFIAARLSAVIVVVDEHLKYFSNAITVCNYPELDEFLRLPVVSKDPHKLIHVGGLGEAYGVQTQIEMLMHIKNDAVHLDCFGNYRENDAETKINQLLNKYNLHHKFNFLGHIPYAQIKNHLAGAMAGLVTLQNIKAFDAALPRKMFEYMACGLPVIASDLPGVRKIITCANCGILVEPENPRAFAEAVDYLLDHPQEARRMGENGRRAIIEKYNWSGEAKKLLGLYRSLLADM